MHVERLMIVGGFGALGWFTLYVPVDLALRTCRYRACLCHSRIFAELATFDGHGHGIRIAPTAAMRFGGGERLPGITS